MLKVRPTQSLHVLLSPVSQELVSFVDLIILLLLTHQILRLGKTLWRWYALRVFCAQKKTVIWYSNDACWLFVDEGVFQQPTTFQGRYYQTRVWTLVDSVDTLSGPPIGLIAHGTQHFVVYTTSPTASSWNKLHQSMSRTICVMNPWTKAEIHKA
jgi:hypothetical protein